MSDKVKPLLIVKLNKNLSHDDSVLWMKVVADGIAAGALVIGSECDVIAFDDRGHLVYPK